MELQNSTALVAIVALAAGPALADPALAAWNVPALPAVGLSDAQNALFAPFQAVGEGLTAIGEWVAEQQARL